MDITPQLIEQITQQVLKLTGQPSVGCANCNAPKLLVVGPTDALPAALKEKYCLCTVENYGKDGDITAYEAVILTGLTNAQLCDIALGRDSQPATCAVIKALLLEKKVIRLPHILPYRQVSPTKGNSGIYQTLEGYRNKLKAYGVLTRSPEQLLEALEGRKAPEMPKGQAGPSPVAGKRSVISAREAQELVKSAQGGLVEIPAGALVTPLARDVFRSAKVDIQER